MVDQRLALGACTPQIAPPGAPPPPRTNPPRTPPTPGPKPPPTPPPPRKCGVLNHLNLWSVAADTQLSVHW